MSSRSGWALRSSGRAGAVLWLLALTLLVGVAVPALGKVTAPDLLRFLKVDDNSSCPRDFLHDLPERIVRKTGGDFEETVELLEDTERRQRWWELNDELPKAPRRRRPREDREF